MIRKIPKWNHATSIMIHQKFPLHLSLSVSFYSCDKYSYDKKKSMVGS